MVLLSVNAGSSSLKVAVFEDSNPEAPLFSVSVEEIGSEEARLAPEGKFGGPDTQVMPIKDVHEAASIVQHWLQNERGVQLDDVKAIGYRVVHGGERYHQATEVTDDLLSYLKGITPLAPNHMPATIGSITAFQDAFPHSKHVTCFDTAFFADVPTVAKTLPIPKQLQDDYGIRRYGFHGLSYQSLLDSFGALYGAEAAKGRIIICHLGSGASVAAIKNGAPMDMSMGFTPVSGIMMSTRTGDLEPGVLTYLQTEHGMSATDIARIVTHESGLKGVSGKTADMLTLLNTQATDPAAALAIELFAYKIKKQIGAYMAVLGGVDNIIFSGGIGERSAEIRRRVCEGLEYAGITIDENRNQNSELIISTDESTTKVHVIATREDTSIIKSVSAML